MTPLPVTVVIPILNEAATLPALMAALEAQTTLPAGIIFIDAGSSDGSPEIVADWWKNAKWPGGNCHVLSHPGAMPGTGRNIGIQAAETPWIAFLDAGIQPEPTWLESLFACQKTQDTPAVYGMCRFSAPTPTTKAICALSYGCGTVLPVLPASLFHREVFARVGFFSAALRAGEDVLWLDAYQAVYGPRKVCPQAIVNYRHFPETMGKAFKKWFVYEKHATVAGIGHAPKAFHMAALMVTIIGTLLAPTLGLPVLFAYMVARGIVDPLRRSADRPWWGNTPSAAAIALPCGILLDVAKLAGYIMGHLSKPQR